MKLIKFDGNPIISPNPNNEWESLVTCNPGVVYNDGTFYMLYRCAGNDEQHIIRLGLAESHDGFHFQRMSDKPALGPSAEGPDSGGMEDPRIIRIDDDYFITYAYRPCPPGRYWTFPHDVVLKPNVGSNAPKVLRDNVGNSGLAMTRDFKTFRRLGRLTSSVLDDRDVILFPKKIHGQWVMMHRPKEYVGEQWGVKYPSIWLKYSDDLMNWEEKKSHLLLTGIRGTWQEKIGGAAPPILTNVGWLMLYHGVENGGKGFYRVGAVLLDKDNPENILGRTPKPLLEPEHDYELNGFYHGCVFPTGNVVVGDILYVYYGAADKYVGVATCNLKELTDYLLSDECRIKTK